MMTRVTAGRREKAKDETRDGARNTRAARIRVVGWSRGREDERNKIKHPHNDIWVGMPAKVRGVWVQQRAVPPRTL
jgi:hypothetical protein